MSDDAMLERIVSFLRAIGIRVDFEKFEQSTFLPGIEVRNGGLVVDPAALQYPCDLLHEAGHLAVVQSEQRSKLNGNVDVADAEVVEVAAIAWSYAATLHLGLDPAMLFHGGGYRQRGGALLLSFSLGVYPGAALLEKLGLTRTRRPGDSTPAYPAMLNWLAH